jgi:phage gp36-like protein
VSRFLTEAELRDLKGAARVDRLAGASGEDAILAAITAAEAEAVSYLIGRYGLGLPTVPGATPAVLKLKVADLALRALSHGEQISPQTLADAEAAVAWLSRVSRGIVSLGLDGNPPADISTPAILTNRRPTDGALGRALEDW